MMMVRGLSARTLLKRCRPVQTVASVPLLPALQRWREGGGAHYQLCVTTSDTLGRYTWLTVGQGEVEIVLLVAL